MGHSNILHFSRWARATSGDLKTCTKIHTLDKKGMKIMHNVLANTEHSLYTDTWLARAWMATGESTIY